MTLARIMYLERKTENGRSLGDRGPAEIGEVTFSRTHATAYYQGKTFRRARSTGHRRTGIFGNYRCIETGDEYWISGVKARGSNRHWAGGGPVAVAATATATSTAARDEGALLDAIRSGLEAAARDFLGAVRREHPGLRLRAFLFEVVERPAGLFAAAVTDAGLISSRQWAEGYPVEAGDPIALLLECVRRGGGVRWEESPAFEGVDELLRRARELGLLAPGDGTSTRVCHDALRRLDAAGEFGVGEPRDDVILGTCRLTEFDARREFLAGAKLLNPPRAIQRLRRALQSRP
jgi:hypothetical protein